MATPEQIKAVVEAVKLIAETIKELKEVPSGHLYAHLMQHISLDTYNQIIGILIESGRVHQDQYHLLSWVGPL